MSESQLPITVTRPWLCLILSSVLVLALGSQAPRFEVNASADTLLTKGNELYIQSKVNSENFAPQEFLLIGYKPKAHQLFSDQTWQDLRGISADVKALPRVSSVRSLLNVPLPGLAGGKLDPNSPLPTLESYPEASARLADLLKDHPIYEELLINQEQTATALQVLFRADPELEKLDAAILDIERRQLEGPLSDSEKQQLELLELRAQPLRKSLTETRNREIAELRNIIADYQSGAELYLGGVHVLGFQLIEIIKNDLLVFGSAIALLTLLLLAALFRRWRWVIIPVACCAASVLSTLGLFALLGLKATVISANFVALQLILTLAIVVHFVVQYRESAAQYPELSHAQLIAETLRQKRGPCLFAGVSTSVGFASLIFSGLQPVISFGWMMMLAMLVSLVISFLMFPALLALFAKQPPKQHPGLVHGTLNGLQKMAQQRSRAVVISCLLLSAIAVLGSLRLSVENSFINYFKDSTEVHRELQFIDRELGGSTPLDLAYKIPERAQGEQVVLRADTVFQFQKVQHMLEQQQGMGKVMSVVNFTDLARDLNGGKPLTEYELTSIYWLLEKSTRDDLLGSFFLEDEQTVRFSARVQDSTAELDRRQLLEDIHSGLEELGISKENYSLSNLFVLYQDILQRLFSSQVMTLGLVLLALSIAFCLLFRSLRTGLVALAPNVFTTLCIFGVMGWLGIPLDLMTITIAAVALGIAVDDTVHYVHRYRQRISDGDSPEQAVVNSHQSVGYAIIYTTAIIICGFSALAFSDFVPSIYFGLLTGLAMLLAMLVDLLLLPILLRRYVR